MSSIDFIQVSKSIGGHQIIDQFNLHIPEGSFVSLLGPSGCGKTTCLRILSGLENHDSGLVKIDGVTISDPQNKIDVPTEKRNMGMVFQSYAVWPHMNVFENVAFPLKVKKTPTREIRERVEEILEIVELKNMMLRAPHELSGGQQQRVALARGLVMKPKALLLDEPLSNLDTKLREKMRHDIKQIQKKFKLTMLYVTHDQIEAKTMSDIVVVMNKGRILQAGSADEVYQKPANDFVAEFIR